MPPHNAERLCLSGKSAFEFLRLRLTGKVEFFSINRKLQAFSYGVAAKSGNLLTNPRLSLLDSRVVSSLQVKFQNRMPDPSSQSEHVSEVDTALLDAELFIKYNAHDRAIARLREGLESNPRAIPLRERIREICINQKQPEAAARESVALASLYIEREQFDKAYDRLLEARHLDARINIAGGLEAIRRARRPDLRPEAAPAQTSQQGPLVTLAGDLAAINVFDAIQVIENAKLTGTLRLANDLQSGTVCFNDGKIVDAEAAGATGEPGFRQIVEITIGGFEFQKSSEEFPVTIQTLSNTNLILDTLRQLDEAKQ